MIFLKVFPLLVTVFVIGCIAVPTYETTTEQHPIKTAMKEIMELMPTEKIFKIAEEHLLKDDEFKAAMTYMKSVEWTSLLDNIKEKTEWKEFRDYILKVLGFDVEEFSKCSRGFIENITVPNDYDINVKKSLKSFMQDVENVLPWDNVMKVFYKRIINTGIFKQTFAELKSDRFKKIVEKLLGIPEVQRVFDILENMDFNIKGIFTMLHDFLG